MGPIFLTLQWLRGCYKGFAPFCAALSVRDPSVRSGEFLFGWRIFIADEIFCRRNFLPADFSPMGYLSLSMSPGVMRRSWVFWCFRGLWGGEGSGVCPFRAVGWGGGGCLWAVSKLENSARTPRLSSFILLLSFSDTLLVVSILVYDCHLWPLLQP